MAGTHLFMAILHFLLLLSPPVLISDGPKTICIAAAMRPLGPNSGETVAFKPQTKHGHGAFQGPDVETCLPKGFHHSSAPSRYINYHTLGSTTCSSSKDMKKP
ncbi:unnamed protein product [Ilex paraguariensis]|uniref:Uncharacterized protein n=1 Tax=Ilex paraguariensis TaxID=185542 RepID=A0ABC8QLL0_9AQUA